MTTKKIRIKHAPEFKAEALKLAEKVGVAAAARQGFVSVLNPLSLLMSLFDSVALGHTKLDKSI